MEKRYKVVIAQSGKTDIKNKKRYILEKFKYREYAENYSVKIKKAVQELDGMPTRYRTTGFCYRGYDIYIKPQDSHLLFYIVNEEKKEVTVLRYKTLVFPINFPHNSSISARVNKRYEL